jgi:phage baseplate assembly protein W
MRALFHPFQLAPSGRLATTTDYAQIVRGQVIDALMTNLGERVFRPRYGCDIQASLFDPTDELVRRDAASQIKNRLQQLVPRAIIRSVDVVTNDSSIPATSIWAPGEPGVVVVKVVYRPALYATDAEVAVPVASEFITRQRELQMQGGVRA